MMRGHPAPRSCTPSESLGARGRAAPAKAAALILLRFPRGVCPQVTSDFSQNFLRLTYKCREGQRAASLTFWARFQLFLWRICHKLPSGIIYD